MSDAIYERLRKPLDCFPTSFPKTDSGIEIKLLKRLFAVEEAQISCCLPLAAGNFSGAVFKNGLAIISQAGLAFLRQVYILDCLWSKKGGTYARAMPPQNVLHLFQTGDLSSHHIVLLPYIPRCRFPLQAFPFWPD